MESLVVSISQVEEIVSSKTPQCPDPQCASPDAFFVGSFRRMFNEQSEAEIEVSSVFKKVIDSIVCRTCKKEYVIFPDWVKKMIDRQNVLEVEVGQLTGKIPTKKGYLRVM